MASIVLRSVGTVAGRQFGGPLGASIGGRIGTALGGLIDSRLINGGSSTKIRYRGGRLNDLAVQTSTYGKMIPIVYGTVRLGGNIIWSQPIKETENTTTQSSGGGGGKGGGGRVSQTTTTFSYSITLAIAICEGAIDEVYRIWADAKQLDTSQYTLRVYKGDEAQLPDSLISSIEGADKTPAYRGMAYVVFEDFQLEDYGNRIPNFTFEVKKKTQAPDYNGEIVEEMVKGMVMIPGAGEFVYDTQLEYKVPGVDVGGNWVQQASQQNINMHNHTGKANALLGLDQLQETCPNVGWISVVVAWFGTDMDAGACIIVPGVEYKTGAITQPDTWQSAGFTRATARQITLLSGNPQYGGTPDDDSMVRYVTELRNRGFKILFYPLIFMDVADKPWRGELTGSAANVATFFTKTDGYNAFINHYANLMVGKVDAFSIGSELKGLTKVTNTPGVYPAVNALVSLAASVKGILGSSVKVTYAADWSEYHSTTGGWYHMDPLWASSNIDVIGIDAYFPLTDSASAIYDIDTIKAGWTSGEGYDYYYTDPARTTQATLAAAYAWKNLSWFYNNTHTNPGGGTTAWTPAMKKIWFTEYGFPSVDHASNQPNVFYDPGTAQSGLPYFSKGRVDIRAQRVGIAATEAQWKASAIVERMFLWTWDARPYPYWPDLTTVWSDGSVWKTGHWVQGKLGISNLSAIVADLCLRSGLQGADIITSDISLPVDGLVIAGQQAIRSVIEDLQTAYFFDCVESDGSLRFIPRGGNVVKSVIENDIIADNAQSEYFKLTRAQEVELPKRLNVMYLNRLSNYQTATQYAQREATDSKEISTIDLSIVLSDQEAKTIADVSLYSGWLSRTSFTFRLPMEYIALEPADVIAVTVSGVTHRMRITSTRLVERAIEISAVADDVAAYDFYHAPGQNENGTNENGTIPDTDLELLDMPALPGDDVAKTYARVAVAGRSDSWKGTAIYRSDDGGAVYNRILDSANEAVIGTATNALASGVTAVFDEVNTLTVVLLGDSQLQSVTELSLLNGANAAVLGNEVLQFKNASLVSAGTYNLSGLLRGRLGTEWAIGTHAIGERFVLLGNKLSKMEVLPATLNQPRIYKPVTYGNTLTTTAPQNYTHTGVGYKPYSPVHIAGARDVSNNLAISWVRRTRISGEWLDYVDAPLNESAEAYEVEIMNGSSVVRTITGLTSPAANYSAANQIVDFGSVQSSVSVKIYQMSAAIGRGYAGVASV